MKITNYFKHSIIITYVIKFIITITGASLLTLWNSLLSLL